MNDPTGERSSTFRPFIVGTWLFLFVAILFLWISSFGLSFAIWWGPSPPMTMPTVRRTRSATLRTVLWVSRRKGAVTKMILFLISLSFQEPFSARWMRFAISLAISRSNSSGNFLFAMRWFHVQLHLNLELFRLLHDNFHVLSVITYHPCLLLKYLEQILDIRSSGSSFAGNR